MDLKNIGIFKLIGRKMDWLTQRQEVLSHNIANSDTPDFKPQDVVPFDFKTALHEHRQLRMARTSPSHMGGTSGGSERWLTRTERQRNPYETTPDGNQVVLEEQMLKVSETATDYQSVTNLYRKHVAMLKTALGRGGGAG